MSDSLEKPWSDNPYAPQISPEVYIQEKEVFAGYLVGGMLYGILVTLFFQCIGALINPANDMRRNVKLGLVAYTVVLFLFMTISMAVGRDLFSTIYIDIRSFPGAEGYAPGPLGGSIIYSSNDALLTLISFSSPVNQWLSDGLLLYRCYVIYAMSYWAILLPSLIYVASIAAGMAQIYLVTVFESTTSSPILVYLASSYYVICLVLNVLLTLMITTRLILHNKNLQHAIGTSNAASRVYTTIVIMLVESYALYAIALISVVVSWALQSVGLPIAIKFLTTIQVIAPYLIILRVARRRALTGEMISGSKNIGSIRFNSQRTTDGDESFPDDDLTGTTQTNCEAPEGVCARGENSIEEVRL